MLPLLPLIILLSSSVSRSEAGDCVTRSGDPGQCTRERDCEDVVRGRSDNGQCAILLVEFDVILNRFHLNSDGVLIKLFEDISRRSADCPTRRRLAFAVNQTNQRM